MIGLEELRLSFKYDALFNQLCSEDFQPEEYFNSHLKAKNTTHLANVSSNLSKLQEGATKALRSTIQIHTSELISDNSVLAQFSSDTESFGKWLEESKNRLGGPQVCVSFPRNFEGVRSNQEALEQVHSANVICKNLLDFVHNTKLFRALVTQTESGIEISDIVRVSELISQQRKLEKKIQEFLGGNESPFGKEREFLEKIKESLKARAEERLFQSLDSKNINEASSCVLVMFELGILETNFHLLLQDWSLSFVQSFKNLFVKAYDPNRVVYEMNGELKRVFDLLLGLGKKAWVLEIAIHSRKVPQRKQIIDLLSQKMEQKDQKGIFNLSWMHLTAGLKQSLANAQRNKNGHKATWSAICSLYPRLLSFVLDVSEELFEFQVLNPSPETGRPLDLQSLIKAPLISALGPLSQEYSVHVSSEIKSGLESLLKTLEMFALTFQAVGGQKTPVQIEMEEIEDRLKKFQTRATGIANGLARDPKEFIRDASTFGIFLQVFFSSFKEFEANFEDFIHQKQPKIEGNNSMLFSFCAFWIMILIGKTVLSEIVSVPRTFGLDETEKDINYELMDHLIHQQTLALKKSEEIAKASLCRNVSRLLSSLTMGNYSRVLEGTLGSQEKKDADFVLNYIFDFSPAKIGERCPVSYRKWYSQLFFEAVVLAYVLGLKALECRYPHAKGRIVTDFARPDFENFRSFASFNVAGSNRPSELLGFFDKLLLMNKSDCAQFLRSQQEVMKLSPAFMNGFVSCWLAAEQRSSLKPDPLGALLRSEGKLMELTEPNPKSLEQFIFISEKDIHPEDALASFLTKRD